MGMISRSLRRGGVELADEHPFERVVVPDGVPVGSFFVGDVEDADDGAGDEEF